MDAAVEDAHRRGSVSKNKRRKEDTRSPIRAPTRDWAALTREVRKWPEVRSSAVEAWLKTVADLSVVVGEEIYRGADWTMAQTSSTRPECEGGIVRVRINSPFLGTGWILRGERGWDEAALLPPAPTEITRLLDKGSAWGTDVYTDDSDLGLVLLHAGWLRWAREPTTTLPVDKGKIRPSEAMIVTVRVVPRLVRYTGRERNSVKTRNWGNGHDGRSIVVEGVERLKVTKKLMDKKTSRKMRMTEYAQQRLVVLGPAAPKRILKEDEGALNDADPEGKVEDEAQGLIWTKDGAVCVIFPSAYLDLSLIHHIKASV
ncbi:histone deacetylation protein Rxt3-domain-containing protein [Naematelia encephala]|uniref:Histone deacetylation protein Rxt3-domain-containing protein n=1 Tax=Naematelia encephala TaxID=71784 RepID=A0A1Y2AG82_9TREE|nr:histone deacetylation protein Rxt3-domain-containing protein [Naematelia encephala]